MRILSVILFVSCFQSFGAPSPEKSPLLLVRTGCGTNDFLYEVPMARVDALPSSQWHPESDLPPPVSLKRACALAKTAIKLRNPELEDITVGRVSIRKSTYAKKPIWFYEVLCGATTKSPPDSDACIPSNAIILMDGTDVEPRVVPKSR